MQYAMFLVMREIRGATVEELVTSLTARLEAEVEGFDVTDRNEGFGLHSMNGPQVHRLLARITDYLEGGSGQPSRYSEYARRGRGGYEIEHIWANHAERHEHDFQHASEFWDYRNRIGGLLLLPKSFNASYGDLPYAEKRRHYLSHNLLAGSLTSRSMSTTRASRASFGKRIYRSEHMRGLTGWTWTSAKLCIDNSLHASGIRPA